MTAAPDRPTPASSHPDALAAVQDTLRELTGRHVLTGEQAQAVHAGVSARLAASRPNTSPGGAERPPLSMLLAEVGGYLGAAFIVGAILSLAGQYWSDLPRASQMTLLLGPGLLLAALVAFLAWPRRAAAPQSDPARNLPDSVLRLRQVLALAAAGLITAGCYVAVAPVSGEPTSTLIRGTVTLLLALTLVGMTAAPGSLTSLGGLWALGWTGTVYLERPEGVAVLLAGALWYLASARGLLPAQNTGLFAGAAAVFVGAEIVATNGLGGSFGNAGEPGYLILALLAIGTLVDHVVRRRLVSLLAGGITVAVLVPQMIIDYTDGALGASGAFLVSGLSIALASTLAVRRHRQLTRPAGH